MKTNRTAVKKYLVELIDFEGYDLEVGTPTTDAEKVRAAMTICRAEVGHIKNQQEMVEYWFNGLCSVVSLPYLYTDIITTARQFTDFTEAEADKLCENWFHYMAAQFCQLANKYNA
jgi:UDP-N-acetyl-D-mannosaminuronate dehydrogenase